MSYVDNKQDEEKKENVKIENPFKTLLSGETIEESPEEIIAKDPDSDRKELFKKTYAALLDMYPTVEEARKKKKKKEQKKTTAGTMEQSANKEEKKVAKKEKKEDTKEIER